jgi:hypothetical protein
VLVNFCFVHLTLCDALALYFLDNGMLYWIHNVSFWAHIVEQTRPKTIIDYFSILTLWLDE